MITKNIFVVKLAKKLLWRDKISKNGQNDHSRTLYWFVQIRRSNLPYLLAYEHINTKYKCILEPGYAKNSFQHFGASWWSKYFDKSLFQTN